MLKYRSKLQMPGFGPPWHIATRGGKELTVIGSIKSGAWHPKWRLVVSARFLREAYLKSNRTFCDIADAASTNKMPLAPTVIQF